MASPPSVLGRWRWPIRVAIAVLILAGIALIGNYGAYHEWPWSTYPSRLSVCGRDFQPEGRPQTRAQIARTDPSPLARIGDVPGWLNSGELWAHANEPPFTGICRVVMFVRGGPDQFKVYALEGGP